MSIQSWPNGWGMENNQIPSSLCGVGKVFTSPDAYDYAAGTLTVTTVEQLVYAIRCETACTILLNPANNIFEVQNDPTYREGFNGTCYWGSTHDMRPASPTGTVTIQGVQITGPNFMSVNANSIQRVYLKDCVHTKTEDQHTFVTLGGLFPNFEDCALSMHVRVGEHHPQIDGDSIHLTRCARYIEFSDIDDSNCAKSSIFEGHTTNCSTIVRNATFKIDGGAYGYDSIIRNSTNSSWDVEFYKLYFSGGGSSYRTEASPRVMINNCFVSIKYKDAVMVDGSTYDYQDWINEGLIKFDGNFSTDTIGVNIYNYASTDQSDSRGYRTIKPTTQQNVKQLSDADCRTPSILNKWGFFVNTQNAGG